MNHTPFHATIASACALRLCGEISPLWPPCSPRPNLQRDGSYDVDRCNFARGPSHRESVAFTQSVARLNHQEGLFRAIAPLIFWRRLAPPAEGPMSSEYQKSTTMNSILDIRSAGGALGATETPAFTSGATKSEKQATSTLNLVWVRPLLRCTVETLQEFAGIVLAILYSLAAFGLATALLFCTFTR